MYTTSIFYLFFPERQLFNMDTDFALLKGVERINLKQLLCITTDCFPSKHQVLFSCYVKF